MALVFLRSFVIFGPRKPACSAGPPGCITAMSKPRSVSYTFRIPVSGRITWPLVISSGTTRAITLTGMANPTPVF